MHEEEARRRATIGGALSEHGRQIKLASPTPQIGTRPAPVVEFALVYSKRCGKLKQMCPCHIFSAPSDYPAFSGMGHAKIISAVFFVCLSYHSGCVGHAKALHSRSFEVETSNINCMTWFQSMHTNLNNVIEGVGCNGLPHLLIDPTAQTPL